MEIKIRYHDNVMPIEIHENGDWIDLRAAKKTTLFQGEAALISLGVSMELPEGYEAVVIPRSSTFKKYGIIQTNGVGLIDNSYCGDDDVWHFPAYAVRDTVIPKNERICQFRIQKKMDKPTFQVVDRLEGKNRGGFGSTGRV